MLTTLLGLTTPALPTGTTRTHLIEPKPANMKVRRTPSTSPNKQAKRLHDDFVAKCRAALPETFTSVDMLTLVGYSDIMNASRACRRLRQYGYVRKVGEKRMGATRANHIYKWIA